MLKALVNFIRAINKNSHPGEIAHAICCGMLLGFLPKNNALWYILAVCFIFMRIQKSAFVIFTLVFSLITPFLDPTFDLIGYTILKLDSLQPFFIFLMKLPLVGYTRFYNSIVMGSLLSGLILYIPVYWIGRALVQLWRKSLAPFVRKLKIFKVLSKLSIVSKIKEVANA